MKRADIFVILDDVQFKKNEWQNRNRINGGGSIIWLTVPVYYSFGQKINEVRICYDTDWQKKHIHTFNTYYSKAEYFHLLENFSPLWNNRWEVISDINMESIKILRSILDISTPLYLSSKLGIESTKTDRLISLCKEFSVNCYLSGQGAKGYLDEEAFRREKIELIWQEFEHPTYKQLSKEFISNLSSIDAVLNIGLRSRELLQSK